ncbi:DUF397 domain-containing protein [Streptomyces sp. NBC_00481]|uniref:DUF397 domain-containing protein n=1 Tax=unclassified Streptomyces TaxID=2593676 RepID=UPI002DDB421C|nr:MULTISPECIES: DUF397 domain-containing protein [unclassified Streptomyces]WRY99282.1 DUF397 domain-containing protein [Streptomyces sp. NBC_00481]
MSMSELAWFKSSYSGSEGDSCVEVAVSWQGSGAAEVVRVRDSKEKRGPQLALSPTAWNDFASYAAQV